MSNTLCIFSMARFSNLANVFTKSEKSDSELYILPDAPDRYSAPDIDGNWSADAGVVRYCLNFQLKASTIVTVIMNAKINEIDNGLTALGLVEEIVYVAIIDEDSTAVRMLEGFQRAFRGYEILRKYNVIDQQAIDSLNDKFNSIYKYKPTY